jgi:predicted PurR-regulated permease PerM
VPAAAPHLAALAAVALCAYLTVPFLPALAWALALAIVAHPLHRWVEARVPWPDTAAGLSTALVALLLVVPSYLVVARLTSEASRTGKTLDPEAINSALDGEPRPGPPSEVEKAAEAVEKEATAGAIGDALDRVPTVKSAVLWARDHVDPEELRKALLARAGDVTAVLQGSVSAAFQLLAMLFILFYFFRDGGKLMAGLRGLAPLSPSETERLSCRVHDSVYGTFVAGAVQGVTGGLLFWWLGLPAPVLWGTVMFVLGVLPLLGAVLVWLPAAVYLALEGRLGPAALLVGWGLLMAGPVGNFIYARCAGDRMRLHPVPTLLAYLGGLAVFGVTGMVLGPVTLALTLGLIEVWRGRMTPEPAHA